MKRVQNYQSVYYNKKHTSKSFAKKQLMWFDFRDIKMKRLNKKLNLRKVNFYRIVKKINSQIYQFNLLFELRIHNVFHVSKIHEHQKMSEINSKAHYLVREISKEHREYVIRDLIDFFKKKETTHVQDSLSRL